ncbi:MAG: hypothetical protein GX111_01820 [Clostridiales bacterium]|nr:hypothetical protein [Clostridiales bacterium]
MKTTVKAVIAVIFTILAAVLFRYMYLVSTGRDDISAKTTEFQDYMMNTKEMFLEKSIPIQKAVYSLSMMNDFSLLSSRDGTIYVLANNEPFLLRDLINRQAARFLEDLMNRYLIGERVFNIQVTQDNILFFTKYNAFGYTGFLYERVLDQPSDYQLIEMAGQWKIFYHAPELELDDR